MEVPLTSMSPSANTLLQSVVSRHMRASFHLLQHSADEGEDRCCWGKEQILVFPLGYGMDTLCRWQCPAPESHRKQGWAVLHSVASHRVLFDARYTSWCHPSWMWLHFIYHRYIWSFSVSHLWSEYTTCCDLLNRLQNFKWLVTGADSRLLHIQANLNFAAVVVRVCIKKNMGVVEGGGAWRRAWRREDGGAGRSTVETSWEGSVGFWLTRSRNKRPSSSGTGSQYSSP